MRRFGGSDPAMVATGINLAIEAVTAEVVRTLDEADVRCIVLKGPALIHWLYARDARHSTDVDLLVSPKDFELAEACLSKLSYTLLSLEGIPHDRPWSAHEWHGPHGIAVDLHRALVGVQAPAEEAWRALGAETETASVGDTRVEVLGPVARCFHLALHAAQHGIRYEKALADLECAVETQPPEVWREAAELAQRLDAVAAFAAGLRLVPAAGGILDGLVLPEAQSVDATLLASSPPQTAGGFAWLASIPGARAKTAFLVRKLFPPADWLRTWSRLARRGRLGLVAAYVWRPVWLLWHAGPGLFAWRRARRHARNAE
jgi:Uncharacterised nucleotidyltransferase